MPLFNETVLPDLIKVGEVSSIDPAKCTARVVFDDEDGIVSYDLPVLQRNTYENHDYQMPGIGEDVLVLFLGPGQEDGFIIGSFYAGEITPPESTPDRRTVVFEDETRACYDRKEHKLTVTIEGTEIVFDRKDGTVTVPKAWTVNCETATINATKSATVNTKTATLNADDSATVNTTTARVNASANTTIDSPTTNVTGVLNVTGLITGKGGFAISGGGGATCRVTGNIQLDGGMDSTQDVVAGGISLQNHSHTGVHGETSSAH